MAMLSEDVSLVEEVRGREAVTQGKKPRGASKVRGEDVALLGERISFLENTLGVVVPKVEKVESDVEALASHTFERFDQVRGELDQLSNAQVEQAEKTVALDGKVMAAIEAMQAQLDSLKASLKERHGSRMVVGPSSSMGVRELPRLDLPKPKEFKGVRDAKEVENFLWLLERYFEGAGIDDEATKIRTASLFLSDNAILWWRRKHADMQRGLCSITTWEEFKRELRKQFFPENVVYEAKRKLRELRHKTTISDYVREFTTLTLHIPSMGAKE